MPTQEACESRTSLSPASSGGIGVRRVAVVGNAGGGKTTLSQQLGAVLSVPVYALDSIKWRPGWEPVPDVEVARQCHAWIEEDRWVIDGFGTWEFMAAEFDRAEVIVLLDLPLAVHYWRAMKRQMRDVFRARPDLPENCPMLRMTVPLLKTIWFTHKLARPKLLELVGRFRESKTVLHIQSRAALDQLQRHPASLAGIHPL